jgi:hypothetical protein
VSKFVEPHGKEMELLARVAKPEYLHQTKEHHLGLNTILVQNTLTYLTSFGSFPYLFFLDWVFNTCSEDG